MTIEAEIQDIKEMLDDIPDDFAKYSTIIEMGDELEPYPEEFKLDELKVPGCQSDLWLMVEREDDKDSNQQEAPPHLHRLPPKDNKKNNNSSKNKTTTIIRV